MLFSTMFLAKHTIASCDAFTASVSSDNISIADGFRYFFYPSFLATNETNVDIYDLPISILDWSWFKTRINFKDWFMLG